MFIGFYLCDFGLYKDSKLHKMKILYNFSTKIYNSGKKVEIKVEIRYNYNNEKSMK